MIFGQQTSWPVYVCAGGNGTSVVVHASLHGIVSVASATEVHGVRNVVWTRVDGGGDHFPISICIGNCMLLSVIWI